MDGDLSKLVKECDWHPYVCNIGVGIQGDGDESIVKSESNEIMFDVYALGCGPTSNVWTSIIHSPFPLQKYRGYTNFYLFAGVYVGYLFWYLEELSKAILKRLNVNDLDSKSIFCHPGLALIYNWIKLVVST
jgi:hypothetical protein